MDGTRLFIAAVCALYVSSAFGAEMAQVEFGDVFPYGVYVGGTNPECGAIEGEADLKEMIDRVCADLAAHHMNCACLRITNTYGPRHQMMHDEYGVVNWFIRKAIDNEPLPVFVSQEKNGMSIF